MMAPKKSALGKGLEALIPDIDISGSDEGVKDIDINEIEPNSGQPRKKFDEEKMQQLADSIKEHGIVQPILVIKDGDFYKLVAGERRWRAARIAGLKTIPAVVKDFSESEIMEISLIENIQREDLNPMEEADAYKRLIEEFGMTQEKIAERVGKSRSAVANILRLINLDERIKDYLIDGVLSEGHARALVMINDAQSQYDTAKKIIDGNLNVRQTEKLVKSILLGKIREKSVKKNEPFINEAQERLKNILGTKVNIIHGRRKGKIEIEYYSYDDLERIIDMLNN
jgi:ParB family chromosome partitioning protein